jgi:ATP-binding cassette subfamily B protein
MLNLTEFLKNRSILIIEHSLKTVQNADNIIIIVKEKIIEWATHNSLVKHSGYYSELLKNQVSIGQ